MNLVTPAEPAGILGITGKNAIGYHIKRGRLTVVGHRAIGARGIPARPYFPPIHLQPFYRGRFGLRPGDFPVTEAAGASCLALPFFGTMREEQVDTVCGALAEVLGFELRADTTARRAVG